MRVAQRRGVTISVTMNCGFKPSSQAVVVFSYEAQRNRKVYSTQVAIHKASG